MSTPLPHPDNTTNSNPEPEGQGSAFGDPQPDVQASVPDSFRAVPYADFTSVPLTPGATPPASDAGGDTSYVLGLPRPEPVLDAARIGGLISALAVAIGAALVVGGLASAEEVNRWVVTLSAVISAFVALAVYVAPVWQAHKARRLVTPLLDPRDASGRKLS